MEFGIRAIYFRKSEWGPHRRLHMLEIVREFAPQMLTARGVKQVDEKGTEWYVHACCSSYTGLDWIEVQPGLIFMMQSRLPALEGAPEASPVQVKRPHFETPRASYIKKGYSKKRKRCVEVAHMAVVSSCTDSQNSHLTTT